MIEHVVKASDIPDHQLQNCAQIDVYLPKPSFAVEHALTIV
jgi:hypothetical protein